MAKYTRQDILDLIEEEDVKFIRLQFTDIAGNLKNIKYNRLLTLKYFVGHLKLAVTEFFIDFLTDLGL